MVTVKMLPAANGDCFLITINDNSEIFNILVDGGVKKTYEDYLRDLLIENTKYKKLNLVINTHIHDDHIVGLIELLSENNINKIIDIEEIWFNSLDKITDNIKFSNDANIENDKLILRKINQVGHLDKSDDIQDISPKTGIALSSLIKQGAYKHNTNNGGKAINADIAPINLTKNTKLHILSPTNSSLEELKNTWITELAKKNFKFSIDINDEAIKSFEFILGNIETYYESKKKNISSDFKIDSYEIDLSKVDSSTMNKSSISFVIEAFDKKFLFLGDSVIGSASDCQITKKLENICGDNFEFELIKLPHHGSAYNINEEFLEKFKGKEYFISTDGKHEGHPSLDVIIKIIKTNTSRKIFVTNYPLEELKKINNIDLKDKYNYELLIGNGTEIIERKYK